MADQMNSIERRRKQQIRKKMIAQVGKQAFTEGAEESLQEGSKNLEVRDFGKKKGDGVIKKAIKKVKEVFTPSAGEGSDKAPRPKLNRGKAPDYKYTPRKNPNVIAPTGTTKGLRMFGGTVYERKNGKK